jgi:hypothetical protein
MGSSFSGRVRGRRVVYSLSSLTSPLLLDEAAKSGVAVDGWAGDLEQSAANAISGVAAFSIISLLHSDIIRMSL